MEATVLLLQGGEKVPCKQWKARVVHRIPAQAHTALSLVSRTGNRIAVMGLIIQQGLGPEDKEKLPVVIEVENPEALAGRGALARLVMRKLEELALPAQVPQPGPSTKAKQSSGQRGSRLPKVKRGLEPVGRETWMGTTVVRLVETKVRKQQERHPFPSKTVIAALKSRVPAGSRLQVTVGAISRDDGDAYLLPGGPATASAPWGPAVEGEKEIGSLTRLQCDIELNPHTLPPGSLHVKGNVDRELADTARLARDCLWLHRGWISAYLGKQPVQNPTTAVVRLHLAPAHGLKGGASLGAAFLVQLVGFYWDVELRSDAIAITGQLSLSGHVSSVDGIREKLLGTFRGLVRKLPSPSGVMKDWGACLLLPADNMRYGKVGTYRDLVDGAGFDKVEVPSGVSDLVSVFAVKTLYDLVALCFPHHAGRPPHMIKAAPAPENLATTRSFLLGMQGGVCQAVEVALIANGTGQRVFPAHRKAGVKDAIEAGLVWMRTYWAEIKQALPGPAQHLPTATDFDLVFDVPGSAIEDHPHVSASAVLCVLSLLLRRPLPGDTVVLAECTLDGTLEEPRGVIDETALRLAKANAAARVLTTPAAARMLRSFLAKRPKQFAGIQVLPVSDMLEVCEAVWPVDEDEDDEVQVVGVEAAACRSTRSNSSRSSSGSSSRDA